MSRSVKRVPALGRTEERNAMSQNPYENAADPNGQPPQGYPGYPQAAGNSVEELGRIQLNAWLSVFFGWIPALIFYVVDKQQGPLVTEFHRQTLNFSLLRLGVGLLTLIPVLGWFLAIGSLVLFVFAIIAAVKAPEEYRAGRAYHYPFNLPLVQ